MSLILKNKFSGFAPPLPRLRRAGATNKAEEIMKRVINYSAVLIVLLAAYAMPVGGSVIVNGSFEANKWISDISVKDPNGWDVNAPPSGNLGGYVSNGWATEGNFSLTLNSYWYTAFEANDMIYVAQDVLLTDVNHISFDLQLDTYPTGYAWNINKRTAAVLIDDEIVWSSDIFDSNAVGVHTGQSVNINITDGAPHKLSLALIADVDEEMFDVDTTYYAYWDNVRLGMVACIEYLPEDFNMDCRVDAADLAMLANVWLDNVEAGSMYNLSHKGDNGEVGIVNFYDFAVFAQKWLEDSFL